MILPVLKLETLYFPRVAEDAIDLVREDLEHQADIEAVLSVRSVRGIPHLSDEQPCVEAEVLRKLTP